MYEEAIAQCKSCRSLSGERRISPGPVVYQGTYWVVEHAYPVKLPGWLVAVLRRHVEAVHELSEAELVELGRLLALSSQALHAELRCEKEYVAVYAESPGFSHVHVHIIPRSSDLPDELKGPRIFALLGNATPQEAVPPDQVAALCRRLRDHMEGRAPRPAQA